MKRRHLALVPVVILTTGACFATREDVRALDLSLRETRAERLRSDSLLNEQIQQMISAVSTMNDSVKILSGRLTSWQGSVRGELFEIAQQLVTIQELTGQSQRRLQEVRASLEQRLDVAPPPTATDTGGARLTGAAPATAPAASVEPGPNTLFQLALDQLRRGSAATARLAFQELLTKHPTSDLADDAQFYLAEAYAAENQPALADSVYGVVVIIYPESPRAPTALFKQALARVSANDAEAAKVMFNDLITRYPRSDEAALARERLRTLP
ncbi:MAG TPA: tetratricopeptide repeat protein [Gemmatimonadaceae bacterium]|nr:tetratricopeptide repeat protein [Gemmatimonadaceae bacterium]